MVNPDDPPEPVEILDEDYLPDEWLGPALDDSDMVDELGYRIDS